MKRTVVVKGDILWADGNYGLEKVEDGYLVFSGTLVEGVYPSLPPQLEYDELYDATGCLVVPGLVDLHAHAPQFPFRGTALDLELMEWLSTYTFPEEAKYSDTDYASLSWSMFSETMRRSATTRCVLFSSRHTPATLLLMDAMEKTGLVSYVGKVNMDRLCEPPLVEESPEASERDTLEWLEQCASRCYRNTRPILTPRFVPSCSDELMGKLSRIRDAWHLPVQSHLSENHGEIETVRRLSPRSAFYGDAYEMFGLFGGEGKDGCIMAHCVHSGPEEIALMKKNGVFVAHCPESNSNLASGIAPVRKYMEEGLSVGLGSDIAGGTTESIFSAITECVKVSKLYWRLVDTSARPLSFSEAFHLATRGGGAFFGKVGAFEKGYEADVLVLSDSHLPTPRKLRPEERLQRFSYLSGDTLGVKAKWVRGERVL